MKNPSPDIQHPEPLLECIRSIDVYPCLEELSLGAMGLTSVISHLEKIG